MEKHKQEASEIHKDDGSFKELFMEFLDRLDKTYQQNIKNPSKLQKELKKLVKTGQDMVLNVQVEVRFAININLYVL